MKRLLLLAAFVASPLLAQTVRLDPVLRGGREALIRVDRLPAGVSEWEAFLSVDGGAHYAVRITPHLDANIRSIRFHVPNVTTRDARILLRVGNEEHERIIAVPQAFAIEADYARIDFGHAAATEARGESARFDEDRVVEWRDADRELRHRDPGTVDRVSSVSNESVDSVAPTHAFASVTAPRLIGRIAHTYTTPPTVRAAARDTLLLSTRMNV
jgi:hypothetical protein